MEAINKVGRPLPDMELKDTVELMLSDDYKDRFMGEFHQTRIRYFKLRRMLEQWDNGELDFTPTCPRGVLQAQLSIMEAYLDILNVRKSIEGLVK